MRPANRLSTDQLSLADKTNPWVPEGAIDSGRTVPPFARLLDFLILLAVHHIRRRVMHNSDILVGIVTLNRRDKLVRTLAECRRLGFHHIVVLDNGSADGTRDFLQKQPDIACILSERNEGGSGGFNRIMRYFIEHSASSFLLTMDDDAYPTFKCAELALFLENRSTDRYPAYAFRVTYPHGSLCEMNRPGLNVLTQNPFWKLKRDFHIEESTEECSVDFAGFVGLLIKRETIQNVGIVSKNFFIYSDDTYYTLSISRSAGKLLYYPKFVFIHDCKRSSRHFANHDPLRLERDVTNKVVVIREFSSFKIEYVLLYIARLIFLNPKVSASILLACGKGLTVDCSLYRNETI